MNSEVLDSPENLWNWASKNVSENIEQRRELHKYLAENDNAKKVFLACCFADPRLFFNLCLWTLNSQEAPGKRNLPFILWSFQEKPVLRIKEAIDAGWTSKRMDLFFDKSRKQGATYLILGVYLLYWFVSSGSRFLLGSRKEELVDEGDEIIENCVVGSEESLFYKLLYMLNAVKRTTCFQPNFLKKHKFLQNLDMDTSFKGEATNIGFGKSYRSTSVLVDEAAQIEPSIAGWIIENVADTSNCCIFNSTTGPWGGTHPYSRLLKTHPQNTIVLDWLDNPNMNLGKYKSTEDGFVEIGDIKYWKEKYPQVFQNVEQNKSVKVCDLNWGNIEPYPFIADSGRTSWGYPRSVWYDEEEKRPGRTKRGMAQNILRSETCSTDLFFSDFGMFEKLRVDFIKHPDYQGNIIFTLDENKIDKVGFVPGGSKGKLKWWGEFVSDRPLQFHNYIIGADISRGTGKSNSVAAIYDVNTSELVGLWTDNYTDMPTFAEQVVAICEWCGGTRKPFLIWEANGADLFDKIIRKLGYWNVYTKRDERAKVPKFQNKRG
jgi:hypothetical protein